MTVSLVDTTVLNNLAQIERPELLHLLTLEAATTTYVLAELQVGVNSGYVPACDWSWLPVLALTAEEKARMSAMLDVLDAGEASCVAVALSRGYRLLTDDAVARRYALWHGIAISGTLGMLLRLVESGNLSMEQANGYLATMVARGYRSPVKSLREL